MADNTDRTDDPDTGIQGQEAAGVGAGPVDVARSRRQ